MSKFEIVRSISPNTWKNRLGHTPDIITFHQTTGNTIGPAINTFMNDATNVAPTFLLGRGGEIMQFTELWDGPQCNNTTDKDGKVPYMNSTSPIVRSRPYNANFYTYAIECVASGKGALTPIQYEAAIWLCKYIFKEHKKLYKTNFIVDDAHIIGHCVINPAGRSGDPGPAFPMNNLIRALGGRVTPGLDEIEPGDIAVFRGTAYRSCYGEKPAGIRTGTEAVTKVYKGKFAPYRIGNIGFFTAASVKLWEDKT